MFLQAGKILAEYCANNGTKFTNKRIIELGSGLGLTGISTVMNCQPQYYCFTDAHENVLEYMIENVKMNLGDRIGIDDQSANSDGIMMQAKFENCEFFVSNLPWEEELPKYVNEFIPDFILAAGACFVILINSL